MQDNLKNTYSFNFTSDGEMPYIVDRENLQFRTGDDGRKYLDVTLADNFCLAGATLYSTQWKTNVNNGKKEMSIGSNYYGLLSEAPAGHLLCGGLRLRHEPVCLSRDPA